jgi:hypothetical protein
MKIKGNNSKSEETPTKNQSSIDPQKTPMRSRKKVLIYFLSSLFFILFLITSIFFVFKFIANKQNDDIPKTPDKSSNTNQNNLKWSGLKFRNFDKKDQLLGSQYYSNRVLDIPENDLDKFSCSETIYEISWKKPDTGNDELNNYITLLKPRIEKGFKDKEAYFENISSIFICKTTENKKIINYELHAGEGGMKNSSFFGEIINNEFVPIVTIPNNLGSYFACTKILQVEKSGAFYVRCGGGDGGFGAEVIYKIDPSLKEYKQVVKCATAQTQISEEIFIKCE